jgi:serine/threonine protein kinase
MEVALQFRIAQDAGSITIELGDVIGRGATATVHAIRTRAFHHSVAKIYRQVDRFQPGKIAAMLQKTPRCAIVKVGGNQYPQFAWPTHIVLGPHDEGRGYLMPRIDKRDSLTLEHYSDLALLDEQPRGDERSLSFKLCIAHNLSSLLAHLHAQKHAVIDLKPQNIKVFRRTHIVTLLDCDSYRIEHNGRWFPATNFTPDYIAPEALRNEIPPQGLTETQDRFALAVILFQLLNGGIHPFQGIQTGGDELPTNDAKVGAGLYAHGRTPNPQIHPLRQSMHFCFADATHDLFDRAFTARPSGRPTANEWKEHFASLLAGRTLERCSRLPNDSSHIHFGGKPCGACHFEQVAGRMTAQVTAPPVQAPAPTQPRRSVRRLAMPTPARRWKRVGGAGLGATAGLAAVVLVGAILSQVRCATSAADTGPVRSNPLGDVVTTATRPSVDPRGGAATSSSRKPPPHFVCADEATRLKGRLTALDKDYMRLAMESAKYDAVAQEAALVVADDRTCVAVLEIFSYARYRASYTTCSAEPTRYADAERAAIAGLKQHPDSATASALHCDLGRIAAARLDWTTARSEFDQALTTKGAATTRCDGQANEWLSWLRVIDRVSQSPPSEEARTVAGVAAAILTGTRVVDDALAKLDADDVRFLKQGLWARHGARLNAGPLDWFWFCEASPVGVSLGQPLPSIRDDSLRFPLLSENDTKNSDVLDQRLSDLQPPTNPY